MEIFEIELFGIIYEIKKDIDGKFIKPDFLLEIEPMGSAMKPAHEPIVVARKPLSEKSIAENVLKHGTGGINIDGSRIGTQEDTSRKKSPLKPNSISYVRKDEPLFGGEGHEAGRFPANIIFDEEAGQLLDEQSGIGKGQKNPKVQKGSKRYGKNQFTNGGMLVKDGWVSSTYNDMGGASRFFYCPKASKKDRNEGDVSNGHPTVKPTDLMRYLINLITPPNGVVLDPFMGSGSTGKAAVRCGLNFIGIEKEQEYMDIAKARIEHEKNKPIQQTLFNGEI
jgi:hypothetical protein